MKTETRLGTFDDIAQDKDPAVVAIARRLRAIIEEIHPDATEVPRPGENAASYGVGPKKMSEAYAYIMMLTDRVNLGFYHGVAVDDPKNLLEGTGKRLRHVKINTMDEAEDSAIRDLLRASLAERREATGK